MIKRWLGDRWVMVRWWLVFNDIFSWSDGRSLRARHQLEIADLPKAFPAPGNQNWILTIFPGSCESCGSHSPSLPRCATGSSRSYHIGWGFDGSPLIISRIWVFWLSVFCLKSTSTPGSLRTNLPSTQLWRMLRSRADVLQLFFTFPVLQIFTV